MERAVRDFAHQSNGGLIVTESGASIKDRDRIIALAAQHRLPTVYANRYFASAGGLISYGPDEIDQYRRAAEYIDRIFKGEKPAELPCRRRPNLNWRSISRLRKRLASPSRNAARARQRGDRMRRRPGSANLR